MMALLLPKQAHSGLLHSDCRAGCRVLKHKNGKQVVDSYNHYTKHPYVHNYLLSNYTIIHR